MYVDIFGTIPVAEARLAKGTQLGTILSFMMAVTAVTFTVLGVLRVLMALQTWEKFDFISSTNLLSRRFVLVRSLLLCLQMKHMKNMKFLLCVNGN